MTGPEHYRQAETLIERAGNYALGDESDQRCAAVFAAQAQAHAALALAAAVAESGGLVNAGALDVPSPWALALKGGA